ncbi:hypothetical protein EUX98_g4231 [Antrodiella citrinella]|uniref:BSD domain-containing protein n=1 Tax=Antrodiella citrinella TaxID=2447956 RepID=A0A4S4MX88_9APHY|nr:hypothetical protein EUX98_g4231 [Antrodiella citrinella]
MNFLDAYDISSSPTPVPTTEQQPPTESPSLNEEVTQVVGQLSRFWGGFRKQIPNVLQTVQKDIGEAYTQAQKEISKFTADASTSSAAEEVAPKKADADTVAESTKGKDVDEDTDEDSEHDDDDTTRSATDEGQKTPSTSSGHARTASQNFLYRLQSSLPANLVSTVQNVQNQLPESLKQTGSVDFTQLRTTLTSEFQRVQGITRAQAEEYVHKSEGLLREAQEFLKEAVKVVPPEEAGESHGSVAPVGMLWDGSDLWMLPDVGGSSDKGKEKETVDAPPKSGAEGLRAVATRAESLLKQLKHDPEVIKVDPTADERANQLYEQWIRESLDTEEGGINSQHWTDVTQQALSDSVDGSALQATHDVLVPEHITRDTFWMRYFFRVHQVEQDEQRRKVLIQGTMADDEDFSWEDDEDEAISPTTARAIPSSDGAARSMRASVDTLQAPRPIDRLPSEQSSPRTSDADISRRQSSEGSYDVVSSQVSASGDTPAVAEKDKDDDEDDEEEDDDEEGGEEDSDWE